MSLEKNLTDAIDTKAEVQQADQNKLIQNPKQAHNEYKQMTQAVKGTITETGKFWQGMHNGMHEFVDETGKSLAVAGDYYGKALTGKINLSADVKEFGNAIGSSSGQALSTAGDYYFSQVPKGQANLGNDIGQAGNAAANHCNHLDTEQKGHFFGKQVVPLLVPGAIGIVAKEVQGANLIGKAGEAITTFRGPQQLIPAYAGGFAPARAIAAANVGQITGDGTDLTLPGVLLMSRPKGDFFGGQQHKVPDWISEDINKKNAEMDRLNLANKVEELAAKRLTAQQIAQSFSKEPALAGKSLSDIYDMVIAVRSKREIPSMDDKTEFEQWLQSHNEKQSLNNSSNDFSQPAKPNNDQPWWDAKEEQQSSTPLPDWLKESKPVKATVDQHEFDIMQKHPGCKVAVRQHESGTTKYIKWETKSPLSDELVDLIPESKIAKVAQKYQLSEAEVKEANVMTAKQLYERALQTTNSNSSEFYGWLGSWRAFGKSSKQL